MNRAAATALAVAAALAFVAFLAVRAPATLVADAAADAVPGLVLSGVSGSAWRGAATSATLRGAPLGALEWQLAPTALLGGSLRGNVSLDAPGVSLAANIDSSLNGARIAVADANGTAPLAWLERVSGARGPVDGTVTLVDAAVAVEGARVVAASGTARLAQAVVTRPQRLPLGDFTLALSARDGWLNGEVVEATGPVEVAGDVRVTADRRWEVDARVRIPGAGRDLQLVLSLLGPADADGFRPLALRGTY